MDKPTNLVPFIKKAKIKNLTRSAIFCAILCILSMITIPLQPVSMTLSVLGVFIVGGVLSTKYAFYTCITYILLGAVGLPVFSNLMGGVGWLFGQTGGFIMSYPVMAIIVSFSYCKKIKYQKIALFICLLLSLATCYLFGSLWFSVVTKVEFSRAIELCVLPFIYLDLIKIALAYTLVPMIRKYAKI